MLIRKCRNNSTASWSYKLNKSLSYRDQVDFMVMNSAHFITDLGNQEQCDQNQTMQELFPTTYTFLDINITDIPHHIMIGLCLPKSCSQHEISFFSNILQSYINKSLIMFDKKVEGGLDSLGIPIIRSNFTRVSIKST